MKNIDHVIPPQLFDSLNKDQGLILVNGTRQSLIENTVQFSQKKISESSKKRIFSVIKEGSRWTDLTMSTAMTLPQLQSDSVSRAELFKSDVIYFENILNFSELELALRLAEEGRLVVIHFTTPSILTSLHRIFEFVENDSIRTHFIWRLAESISLLYGQTFLGQQDKDLVFAFEMYLVTPELKKLIQTLDLKRCEDFMKSPSENSGFVTLNQSLIQLLLRRKIDLKKAFDVSRDPSDLDQLLKKVGL
jgi:twitching motility protein PilT